MPVNNFGQFRVTRLIYDTNFLFFILFLNHAPRTTTTRTRHRRMKLHLPIFSTIKLIDRRRPPHDSEAIILIENNRASDQGERERERGGAEYGEWLMNSSWSFGWRIQ